MTYTLDVASDTLSKFLCNVTPEEIHFKECAITQTRSHVSHEQDYTTTSLDGNKINWDRK